MALDDSLIKKYHDWDILPYVIKIYSWWIDKKNNEFSVAFGANYNFPDQEIKDLAFVDINLINWLRVS